MQLRKSGPEELKVRQLRSKEVREVGKVVGSGRVTSHCVTFPRWSVPCGIAVVAFLICVGVVGGIVVRHLRVLQLLATVVANVVSSTAVVQRAELLGGLKRVGL